MTQFEYWMTTDLKRGSSQVQVINGQTFTQDNLGNRVGVVVLDGGEPATLSGTVSGYVIRADGGTVVVVGALDGNKAYIDLPESAYAVPGQIQIAIRLTSGSTKTVLGAMTAYVQRTATGTIIDPGHVIPDIDDIIAKMDEMDEAIANANAATAAANTAAQNANNATGYIAPSEASSTASAAHAQGSYLIYDGNLYQATADIAIGDSLATTGTGANIAQVTGGAMGEVTDLKSAINVLGRYFNLPEKLETTDYTRAADANSLYVSTFFIPKDTTITGIEFLCGTSGGGTETIYIIGKTTNKVYDIKSFSVDEGWNTIDYNYVTIEDCLVGIKGTKPKYTYDNTIVKTENVFSAGLYDIQNTSPSVGDVVTIRQLDSSHICAFAISFSYSIGIVPTMGEEIEEIVEAQDEIYAHSERNSISLLDASAYRSTTDANKAYYSDRVILPTEKLTSITFLSNAVSNAGIYIVDSNDKVIDIFTKSTVVGWNTITINKYYPVNVYVVIYNTRCKFVSGSSRPVDYAFSSNGLVECSGLPAVIGSEITKSVITSAYYDFGITWEIKTESGIVPEITKQIAEYDKTLPLLFSLNNFNLLKYKETDGEIGYFGRWFTYNGKPCTNNDGSSLFFKVSGASTITAIFGQISTQTVTPYIAYSIDGGSFTRQQISTTTISLPDANEHIVRIIIDGMTESQGGNKWNGTLGVYVDSITVDAGIIKGIAPSNKWGMFFGDSITEGINALGTGANASVNSASHAYPQYCANALNSIAYFVGYGGTGVSCPWGSFGNLAEAIDYLYNGKKVDVTYPDFIVINSGINDSFSGISADVFQTDYEDCIKRLRVMYSCTPIFCVVPFKSTQPYADEIYDICSRYNNCYYVSSEGWNGETVDGTHLSAIGAQHNGELLAQAILKVLGKQFFVY